MRGCGRANLFSVFLDRYDVLSFRNTNLELRYSGVIPCKDFYIITAADSNIWCLSLPQPSPWNNSSISESLLAHIKHGLHDLGASEAFRRPLPQLPQTTLQQLKYGWTRLSYTLINILKGRRCRIIYYYILYTPNAEVLIQQKNRLDTEYKTDFSYSTAMLHPQGS